MIELTKKHLEIIDYLDEAIQRKDMNLYNRYLNLGFYTSLSNLERVLSSCPWREGMPNLTGKILNFSNGTSAYVIAHFKCGSDNYLQVAKPEEGDLLKYDYSGYAKDKDMVILTVEETVTDRVNTESKTDNNNDLELTDFDKGSK